MQRLLILLAIILVLISCKNKTNTDTKQTLTEENKKNVKEDIKTEYEDGYLTPVENKHDLQEDRAIARNALNAFFDTKPDQVSILVVDYYTVDFIADGNGAPKEVLEKGEWYKFTKDYTYQHGFYDKITDEGKYLFDANVSKVLMLPDDKNKFPSEWKILQSNDVIVMVGTAKFANNPVQKHCINTKNKPTKK